jgi:uncharacterized tellurite resistance protein B-like protein
MHTTYSALELQLATSWAVIMQIIDVSEVTPSIQKWLKQFLPLELMRAHALVDENGETTKLQNAAELTLTSNGAHLNEEQRHKLAQTLLYVATIDGIPSSAVAATVLRAISAIGFDPTDYADAFIQ